MHPLDQDSFDIRRLGRTGDENNGGVIVQLRQRRKHVGPQGFRTQYGQMRPRSQRTQPRRGLSIGEDYGPGLGNGATCPGNAESVIVDPLAVKFRFQSDTVNTYLSLQMRNQFSIAIPQRVPPFGEKCDHRLLPFDGNAVDLR